MPVRADAENLHIDRIRGDDFFELRAFFRFIRQSVQQIVFLERFCIEQMLMHEIVITLRIVFGKTHIFVQIDRCHPRKIKITFPHDPVQPLRRAAGCQPEHFRTSFHFLADFFECVTACLFRSRFNDYFHDL